MTVSWQVTRPGFVKLLVKGVKVLPSNTSNTTGSPSCSFCGKAQEEVKHLVHGEGVSICDECVELCRLIIEEEKRHAQE